MRHSTQLALPGLVLGRQLSSVIAGRGSRLLLAVAIALFSALAPTSASAQSDEDKAKAVELLGSGDAKLKKGDRLLERGKMEDAFVEFESALADYLAALKVFPNPQIYYPIAQAEQRLGRFVEALTHYQQILRDGKDLAPALRKQLEKNIDDIKANLSAVFFEVSPRVEALISIDGNERGRAPMSQPIFVEPGAHTFSITAEGYTPMEGKLDLLPGKESRKEIDLVKLAIVVVEKDDPAQGGVGDDVAEVNMPSKLPLWVGIGASTALGIGGITAGVIAVRKHRSYEDLREPLDEREAARQDGRQLAVAADILLGAAVVGGLVTTYYYYAVYKPKVEAAEATYDDGYEAEATAAAARFQLTPVVGVGMAGVAASGSF